ncbi:hypothetical protein HRR78_007365 [Exophiala dermatitidis]|nr:hypothetical protein HRR75_005378 [Exophiala dermatitidis]KAJ4541775.1 hypothetical protein HRR78_007365 [Exophiala dermatitidis]
MDGFNNYQFFNGGAAGQATGNGGDWYNPTSAYQPGPAMNAMQPPMMMPVTGTMTSSPMHPMTSMPPMPMAPMATMPPPPTTQMARMSTPYGTNNNGNSMFQGVQQGQVQQQGGAGQKRSFADFAEGEPQLQQQQQQQRRARAFVPSFEQQQQQQPQMTQQVAQVQGTMAAELERLRKEVLGLRAENQAFKEQKQSFKEQHLRELKKARAACDMLAARARQALQEKQQAIQVGQRLSQENTKVRAYYNVLRGQLHFTVRDNGLLEPVVPETGRAIDLTGPEGLEYSKRFKELVKPYVGQTVPVDRRLLQPQHNGGASELVPPRLALASVVDLTSEEEVGEVGAVPVPAGAGVGVADSAGIDAASAPVVADNDNDNVVMRPPAVPGSLVAPTPTRPSSSSVAVVANPGSAATPLPCTPATLSLSAAPVLATPPTCTPAALSLSAAPVLPTPPHSSTESDATATNSDVPRPKKAKRSLDWMVHKAPPALHKAMGRLPYLQTNMPGQTDNDWFWQLNAPASANPPPPAATAAADNNNSNHSGSSSVPTPNPPARTTARARAGAGAGSRKKAATEPKAKVTRPKAKAAPKPKPKPKREAATKKAPEAPKAKATKPKAKTPTPTPAPVEERPRRREDSLFDGDEEDFMSQWIELEEAESKQKETEKEKEKEVEEEEEEVRNSEVQEFMNYWNQRDDSEATADKATETKPDTAGGAAFEEGPWSEDEAAVCSELELVYPEDEESEVSEEE